MIKYYINKEINIFGKIMINIKKQQNLRMKINILNFIDT